VSQIQKDTPVPLAEVRRAGTYEVLVGSPWSFSWNSTFGDQLSMGILFLTAEPAYYATENEQDPMSAFRSFEPAQVEATQQIALAWAQVAQINWDWSGGNDTRQVSLGNRKLAVPTWGGQAEPPYNDPLSRKSVGDVWINNSGLMPGNPGGAASYSPLKGNSAYLVLLHERGDRCADFGPLA